MLKIKLVMRDGRRVKRGSGEGIRVRPKGSRRDRGHTPPMPFAPHRKIKLVLQRGRLAIITHVVISRHRKPSPMPLYGKALTHLRKRWGIQRIERVVRRSHHRLGEVGESLPRAAPAISGIR